MSYNFIMFSKHTQNLPLAESTMLLKQTGLQGFDLTVRENGHVEPAEVVEKLPEAVEIIKSGGLDVGMITTSITDINDPYSEDILHTAAKLGIRHFKLGYWKYEGFGTLRRQRAEVKAKLKDITAVAGELDMVAGFHNHSGPCFGANLCDIEAVIADLPSEHIGLYLDPCHATIEGGVDGWEMAFDLLSERLVMVALKDAYWQGAPGKPEGQAQHLIFCQMGQGNVNWPKFFALLKQINFAGPISLHSEYQGSYAFADLTDKQVIEQTAKDYKYIKTML
jgi:sugar phosphate isomerase/epimerase